MAVKAQSQITLTSMVDVKATYRYYLLRSSTLAAPSKPIVFPPVSPWDDTEPTYTDGSTNSLYVVDCTVFSDDTFSYSEVSLSSSYEAAKAAYNKATAAHSYAQQLAGNIYKPGTTLIDGDKLYTGSVGADKINVAELFAQTIAMGGKFTSTKNVFLEPGLEEIETIQAHLLGTATIPSARLALYDFNGDGSVTINDLVKARNAWLGTASLASWSGAVETAVTITIDLSDPTRVITIAGTNMWGREVEICISAYPHISTFVPKDTFDAMFAFELDGISGGGTTKVVSKKATLPDTVVKGTLNITAKIYYPTSESQLEAMLDEILAGMENESVGFYAFQDNTASIWSGGECIAVVRKTGSDYATVDFCSYTCRGMRLLKTKYGGVWTPLEWVNPPMLSGVEYRTTERWLGKAVYTVLVDCGTIGAGETPVTTDFTCSAVIGSQGYSGSISLSSVYESARNDKYCRMVNVIKASNKISISFIFGTSVSSSAPNYVQVWYTKD